MSALRNKTILILSPQSWGTMLVSKHHYAVELAKRGNKVFFLNPPQRALEAPILVEQVKEVSELYIIRHKLTFPYRLKYYTMTAFHWLMKRHIKNILKEIAIPIDIIWSFDLGNLYPFRLFADNAIKIFHPVDEPLNKVAIDSGKGADVILSVTNEILSKYKVYAPPPLLSDQSWH